MTIYKMANWPAPNHVTALTTTRISGFSQTPYDSNNIALHVEDDELSVQKNRQFLNNDLGFIKEPVWLNQTHTTECVIAEEDSNRNADASITREPNRPLVVLTADCLPITLCNKQGSEIAAIHAGWRGLCNGIIENTLEKMKSPREDIMAWIGPAICSKCYEVGDEVYDAFTNKHPDTKNSFRPNGTQWMANLPVMAELILQKQGILSVFQSNLCTFEAKKEFYSYRRTPQTGRIGTFIWLKP